MKICNPLLFLNLTMNIVCAIIIETAKSSGEIDGAFEELYC